MGDNRDPRLYVLLKAGAVLGGFLVLVGLPGAGCCWVVEWLLTRDGKTAPVGISMGISVGLTLAIAGAGLLAIALGFIRAMRRNTMRDDRPSAGR